MNYRRALVWAGPLLVGLVLSCGGGSRTVRDNGTGGGGGGPEATPEVEYIGPQNPSPRGDGQVELLLTTPTRPSGDLGTIRVRCAGAGCSYSAAAAAMTLKAKEIGASGVHSIKEASGTVNEPMDTVMSKNARVFNLAGTAFAYSN